MAWYLYIQSLQVIYTLQSKSVSKCSSDFQVRTIFFYVLYLCFVCCRFSSSHEPVSDFKEKCSPISNIMYVKTHKTGSTTIQSILYRYGFSRNLSFVFRRQNKKNGHIRYTAVTKDSPRKMFLPVLGNGNCSFAGYNISAVHVVHNRPVMETFMNPGAKYITIIRNPASQLISAFLFFHP